jgi:hypothetical protein
MDPVFISTFAVKIFNRKGRKGCAKIAKKSGTALVRYIQA